MRVSVIPFYRQGLGNRMFAPDFNINSHLMEPNVEWFNQCLAAGIELGTYDLMPVEKADLVIFMDLPAQRSEVLAVKRRAPQAKFLLALYESPFERPHWFNPKNHEEFDAVLTFNPQLWQRGGKYFQFYLPVGLPPAYIPATSFAQRLPSVMVNSNFYYGIGTGNRPWHWATGYRSIQRAGWQFGLQDFIQAKRSLYYHGRQKLARAAEAFSENVLDVYGANWNGWNQGWYYRFFPDSPYQTARGKFDADKLTLLGRYRFVIAYENYVSDVGYISEKIFDAFYAGCVPVYLGDQNVSNWIDPDCFVDARKFKSPRAVLQFVRDCDQSTWEGMIAAGQRYLKSEQIRLFQPKHFAETMVRAIQFAVPREKKPVLY